MSIDDIHNYYKTLVIDELTRLDEYRNGKMDQAFLEDVACIALNRLPAKYVRHSVDLIFYMSGQERMEMQTAVENAVKLAIETISKHNKKDSE